MVYCIDYTAEEPIMLLNRHIGTDPEDGIGIDGAIFQQELLQLDSMGKKRIQIWINSPGGNVMDGYSIYSSILKSITPVDTYAIGACASIAAVIFQAGRKRIMADYAWLMYHNPHGGENQKLLDVMKESIIKMIEQRCGMSEDEVSRMMARTTFISAGEALNMKLCDRVDPSVEENTKYLKKITSTNDFHKECNLILNTIINHQNSNTMFPKVTMRLKLNDAATEDNVIKAIDEIENRAVTAEKALEIAISEAENKAKSDADELDKLKALFEKKKAEADKAKADYEDCKSKLDAMEQDKLKAEEEAEADKAKNIIEGYAKVGRIKNEATVILEWCGTAKALGIEKVKNMIEALPLNKKAEEITPAVANQLKDGDLPTTAIGLAVRNKLQREGKLK